jgi:hypothetical protein
MKRGSLKLNQPVRRKGLYHTRDRSMSARAVGPDLVANSLDVPPLNVAFEPLADVAKAQRRQLIRDALRRHGLLREDRE